MTDRPAASAPSPARRPADRLRLSPRHRAQLVALLREHLPGVEVWAYGSRITGESHDGSDLDLVLRAPDLQKIPIGRLSDLWEALRESTIPFLVEARDWARLPEEFRGEIERDYVVLVEGKQANSARSEDNSQKRNPVIGAAVSPGWTELPFADAVWVNPPVLLKHGVEYPFVDMAAIDVGSRQVCAIQHRKYSGGGSRFRAGDTLMARITPCLENGKIARYCSRGASEMAHGSTEFIVIRGRPDVTDTEFSYYLTRWEEVRSYAVSQMTGTSGRQRVPTESLSHLSVPIPPLPEQRAIARVLGALDDKIELNRRMNETLEAMARALFQSWFVDFDPVRAKMEGRDTGLPTDVADLFPDRMVDSAIGLTPDGWKAAPLTELMDVNPKRSLSRGQVAPYLDMANMPTRGHVPDTVVDRPVGSGTRFTNGDTLVARITPCLENGKTAYVDFLRDKEIGWGSTECIVLKPRRPLPGEFAYCVARSSRFREFAIRNMSGTSGRQRVPAAALSGFWMSTPSAGAAAEFGRLSRSLFGRASQAAHESRRLACLRDSLITKLVSGELRVGEMNQPVVAKSTMRK